MAGGIVWFRNGLQPLPSGTKQFIRFETKTTLPRAIETLKERGIVRNASALSLYARWKKRPGLIGAGTYVLSPGMDADQALAALASPIKQMVRIPEGKWVAQVAAMLEASDVCSAKDYIELTKEPAKFKDDVSFPLPQSGSLEGYLYPDTYDLPPLIGAKETIRRQLLAFEKKVLPALPKKTDLRRAVIIGSLIELEVALKSEKPLVAGVIENRLAQKMPLQIDASANYAIQEWRPFKPGEISKIESKYNTYKQAGLPPGPICSPSVESILAAAEPNPSPALYYVAMPDKSHLFAATYEQHLHNIRVRENLLAQSK